MNRIMSDYEKSVEQEVSNIFNQNTINNKENINFLKEKIENIELSISSLQKELESKDKSYGKEIALLNNNLDEFKSKLNKSKKKIIVYRSLVVTLIVTIIILLLKVFGVF